MTKRARGLRAASTPAETALWAELRRDRLGVRFRRQLVFDRRFILDFYAPSLNLAVEVDGGHHAVEADKDAARTAYLVRRGVSVLRFWNIEVNENMDGVLSAITDVISVLSSPLAPLRDGGGDDARKCAATPPSRGGEAFSHLRLNFGDLT